MTEFVVKDSGERRTFRLSSIGLGLAAAATQQPLAPRRSGDARLARWGLAQSLRCADSHCSRSMTGPNLSLPNPVRFP